MNIKHRSYIHFHNMHVHANSFKCMQEKKWTWCIRFVHLSFHNIRMRFSVYYWSSCKKWLQYMSDAHMLLPYVLFTCRTEISWEKNIVLANTFNFTTRMCMQMYSNACKKKWKWCNRFVHLSYYGFIIFERDFSAFCMLIIDENENSLLVCERICMHNVIF